MSMFNFYSIIHYPLVDFKGKNVKYDRNWMEENYGFGGVIPRSYKFFLPKSCFWTGNEASQRQYVGLAPMNRHTRYIARQLAIWKNLHTDKKGYKLEIRPYYFKNE